MPLSELLTRAAAAPTRQDALILVLEAWRANRCAELSSLALALDFAVQTRRVADTDAFCREVAALAPADRGSLLWDVGIERERLAALNAWTPDPRVSALLEEIIWNPPHVSLERNRTATEEEWWETFTQLRDRQEDPLLNTVAAMGDYKSSVPAEFPFVPELIAEFDRTPRLSVAHATLATAVAATHFRSANTADEDRLSQIYAQPDDDAPRLVYADSLLQSGDERGKFIVEQCRDPTTKLRTERHWAGRLAPVLRGVELGFRRGFVSSATVRFRHRADIELFGSLPEWRTVEHLTWASPSPAPRCQFIGPQMELLLSAHCPSPELLLSAPRPWSRLESLTLELVRAEQLAEVSASRLLPRLEALALGWRTDVDAHWFRDVNVSRWKHLELSTLREAYEGLIEALQGSSLETLRFRECELRRGTDGRFSKLKVRAGDWLGFPRLGPGGLSRGLPQGFFESIEFDGDTRMTEDFKREFEPNRRGQRVRHH